MDAAQSFIGDALYWLFAVGAIILWAFCAWANTAFAPSGVGDPLPKTLHAIGIAGVVMVAIAIFG